MRELRVIDADKAITAAITAMKDYKPVPVKKPVNYDRSKVFALVAIATAILAQSPELPTRLFCTGLCCVFATFAILTALGVRRS